MLLKTINWFMLVEIAAEKNFWVLPLVILVDMLGFMMATYWHLPVALNLTYFIVIGDGEALGMVII